MLCVFYHNKKGVEEMTYKMLFKSKKMINGKKKLDGPFMELTVC